MTRPGHLASAASPCRSRGGLEVVPDSEEVPGSSAARGGPRPLEGNPQETPTALTPVRGGPLTEGENRVLRYLPTHLSAAAIAADLYLSANTVRTHLRHLYRKLGAHSRQEAVQPARAIGLLTGSSRRP